jgi:hypothetical protein
MNLNRQVSSAEFLAWLFALIGILAALILSAI